MSFFAVLFALLIEQLKPLPRDNSVHHALVAWVGWTGRNFDAGKRAPCLGRLVRRRCCVPVAAGLRACGWCVSQCQRAGWRWCSIVVAALPDAGLPPVQPLLHRHPRRADARRRRPRRAACSPNGGTSTPANCRAPSCCAMSSNIRCWRRTGMCSASSSGSCCCRPSAWGRLGAVLYRMAEFASRYWGYRQRALDAPANERPAGGGAARLQPHRPCAGAADGLRLRRRRQLRGGGGRLAPRCGALAACQRRHHPGRRGRCRGRAARRRRGAGCDAGPLQDLCQSASRPTMPAPKDRPPGMPPQLGHLQSVVGLVWRSVVLWMLLLALLSLANPGRRDPTARSVALRRTQLVVELAVQMRSALALISPRRPRRARAQPGSWRCVQL